MSHKALNQIIQSSRKSVTSLNQEFESGDTYIDESFQRRSVWLQKNKIRLIETILKGFPMPEIYLWDQSADAKTGKQKHSVVDGQQRLTAIKEYIGGQFSL